MFGKKESPVISIVKVLVVPVLAVAGGAVGGYIGASKGVADTVEAACKGAEKFIPALKTLLEKAEATVPADGDEITVPKEAIKRLMEENAALKNAAKTSKTEEAHEDPKAKVNAEAKATPKAEEKSEAK